MALPVRGDACSAFVALAAHTSSRENEVQPLGSGRVYTDEYTSTKRGV